MRVTSNKLLVVIITSLLFCTGIFSRGDSYKEGRFNLNFVSQDSSFDKNISEKLISAFFTVYPKLSDRFNKNTATNVTFIIDTSYEGVAATYNDTVSFSPEWFRKHPGDIDVVTHEVMHIVQAYPENSGPWWVTEGIADYARYKFGIDNAGADWSLTELKPDHNFDSSYRITARFLVWLEKNKNKNLVDELDKSMREKTYTDDIWEKLTGKSVEDLWQEYISNPAL